MSVFATTRVFIADPLSGRPVGSCRGPRPERRDPHLRSLRDAGADWFGIHPAMLSAVDEPTLVRLLRRVRGGYVSRQLVP